MISALLLICVFGTSECHVDVGKTFFTSQATCERRSIELIELNQKNPLRSFDILDYRCVDWEDDRA